jgi:hypothetical protein
MARFNLEGYSLVAWLKGNKSTVEQVIKVGVPWIASTFVTNVMWQQFLITVVGKWIIDGFDYWISQ